MTATVHIVHCIDTEGPLYEAPEVQFVRLRDRFGISDLAPTRNNLMRLRRGEIDLGGREAEVQEHLNQHLISFLGSWPELDAMLDRATSPAFRNAMPDSFGGGWKYNWFCMDHIHYDYNPRRRDIGYHNIFDRYRDLVAEQPESGDAVHWHFHPMSTFRDANFCATHYFRGPELFDILTRKIIERRWFPTVYRAGFQNERPDSHWFLEQWVPFDMSSMAIEDHGQLDEHVDFRNGRSGDWRLAPTDWSIYRPSHDDWRVPGNCRRWIGRGLNVMNRVASVDQNEMDKAFARAAAGQPSLVGVVGHDWRNLDPEVDFLRGLIRRSSEKFPSVPFKFQEATAAFREMIWPEGIPSSPLKLELKFHPATEEDVPFLEVAVVQGKVFGPQPFLALELKGRRFVHDNLDFSLCGTRWFYPFHSDTVALENVARVGIAANDRYGNLAVEVMDLSAGA